MNSTGKALLITAMTTAIAGFAASSQAESKPAEMEKCFGVAKAGKNDCASGSVKCASHSTKDGESFVMVPKGLCDKLAGGSTTQK